MIVREVYKNMKGKLSATLGFSIIRENISSKFKDCVIIYNINILIDIQIDPTEESNKYFIDPSIDILSNLEVSRINKHNVEASRFM